MDPRRKRIVFRAWRRGFLEIDLILGKFADEHVDKLNDAELAEFERLLDAPDADVYGWIVAAEPPPAAWAGALMARLRALHGPEGAPL
ncbi:MAG: succinate dehydrogenase assembly factor 2 [Hyphomonadaceae bacterium]